jgi:hypothetical protein
VGRGGPDQGGGNGPRQGSPAYDNRRIFFFFILGFLDLDFWRMKMTDFGEGPLSKVGEDKVLSHKLLLKIFLDRFEIEFEIQT